MKKCTICVLALFLLTAIFMTSCSKTESKDSFGECVIAAEFEDLTQDEYTTYLQEANGLDTLLSHKVYHSNGNVQVDFQFSKDAEDWQISSAKKFAVDKFYSRDVAKYDLWDYDTWLIEHADLAIISVTCRVFTENELTNSEVYPDTVYPVNEFGQTYGPDIKENTDPEKEPDLIQVCNEDGQVGYIYASHIKGGAQSLEEAISWEPRTYTVPMYLEDGKTVIGEFTIDGNIASTGTQVSSHSPTWNGEFAIELPDGYTITTDENGKQVYSNGTQTVGGMTIRTVPEGFEITEYFKKDFLIALGIAEAADESLGYYGGGSPGGMGPWGWSEEYFSDVPDPEDRTIHTSHQFFVMSDEKTVLDFWIDLMLVDHVVKDQIFESIEIPEIERYRQEPAPEPTISQDAPYELLDLPEGYTFYILGERCIQLVRNNQHPVAGLDVIKIPDGAYDPDDAHWIWLEKSGISDFNSTNRKVVQYLGGMTGSDNTWIAEFAGQDPEIHRQHIYRVIGNDLYDLWFDLNLITREEAEELAKVIQFSKE